VAAACRVTYSMINSYNHVPFRTAGTVIACIRQILPWGQQYSDRAWVVFSLSARDQPSLNRGAAHGSAFQGNKGWKRTGSLTLTDRTISCLQQDYTGTQPGWRTFGPGESPARCLFASALACDDECLADRTVRPHRPRDIGAGRKLGAVHMRVPGNRAEFDHRPAINADNRNAVIPAGRGEPHEAGADRVGRDEERWADAGQVSARKPEAIDQEVGVGLHQPAAVRAPLGAEDDRRCHRAICARAVTHYPADGRLVAQAHRATRGVELVNVGVRALVVRVGCA